MSEELCGQAQGSAVLQRRLQTQTGCEGRKRPEAQDCGDESGGGKDRGCTFQSGGKMTIFKRGSVYWYHFVFNGKHIQRSTKQGNPRVARQIEAAYRTALSKNDVGITERKQIPGFKEAMGSFLDWSENEHQAKPATHRRHLVSSVALFRHFKDMPLDTITADEVERYKTIRRGQFVTVRGREARKLTTRKIKPAT